MRLSDKVYDVFKWLSLIAFNAVGLCYKTLATIWQLPYGEQVCETCTAIALMLGTLIGISQATRSGDKTL